MAAVSAVSRSARPPIVLCALLSLALVLLPEAPLAGDEGRSCSSPATDFPSGRRASPSPRAPDLLAQNRPAAVMPSPPPGTALSPALPGAATRTEEWRRTIRALEPKELKSGKGWRLLGPGEGQAELSEERLRAIRDEALLLLLELQHDEAIKRLQQAGVSPDVVGRLERQYAAAHACLERRFGASGLPAVLEEARRNRDVLEALVYRLAGFAPPRTTGLPP